jgi:hypothetical protein
VSTWIWCNQTRHEWPRMALSSVSHACAHTVGQHRDSHQIWLWTQISICHACYPQEVHIQSHTWCDVTPNYSNGARGSRRGEGPKKCTCTKCRENSVANSVTFLNSLMNINSGSDYTESAYGAISDSGSSEERCKSRECKNKKAKKSKSCYWT